MKNRFKRLKAPGIKLVLLSMMVILSGCVTGVYFAYEAAPADVGYFVGSLEIHDGLSADATAFDMRNVSVVFASKDSYGPGKYIPFNWRSGMEGFAEPGAPKNRRWFLAKAKPGEYSISSFVRKRGPYKANQVLAKPTVTYPVGAKFRVASGKITFLGNLIVRHSGPRGQFKIQRKKDLDLDSIRAYWKSKQGHLKLETLPIVGL